MNDTPDPTSPEAVERYSPIAVAPHDVDYVRADLCAKSEAISPTQDERVKALVEALVEAVKAMPQDWYDDNCDCGGL